ncbi:unnamed protein product [Durusdinium trenchii]|uniref:Uncharacterized protein n=1 Tax=Durusdinium trenchii TaxID=1381693 RepID=A0ABP0N533_9DINO
MALEKIANLEKQLANTAPATPAAPAAPTSKATCGNTSAANLASAQSKQRSPDSRETGEEAEEDEEEGNGEKEGGDDMIVTPAGNSVISHDALRMRLRRLCEVKAKSKKCHVDSQTHEQWKAGGEGREWLEIALTETLEKLGAAGKNAHKKAEFCSRVIIVRERMEAKESEIHGSWMTEEKLKASKEFSPEAIKSIVAYCEKFPTALIRPWKYNPDIKEYFVETVTKQTIKQSEMRKRTEITDLGEPFQQIRLDIDPLSS